MGARAARISEIEKSGKKRPAAFTHIPVADPLDAQFADGRTAPVARLATMFFDAIEAGGTASPGFAEGYRVQQLIDAARRSHRQGAWIDVNAPIVTEELSA